MERGILTLLMIKNADEFAIAQEMAALLRAVVRAFSDVAPSPPTDRAHWDVDRDGLRQHLDMLTHDIKQYSAVERAKLRSTGKRRVPAAYRGGHAQQ